ncbi:unnamed protein product [Orchesella dallaii]|uniref:O-acyltransferase WSD1 C-terminal domain-containing protein n=1 Tax=Orchesella dallaii TaxID=48710 RepID=A0ABP1RBD0_9HEXA
MLLVLKCAGSAIRIFVEVSYGLLALAALFYIYILTFPFLIFRKLVTRIVQVYNKDVVQVVRDLSALFHRDFDSLEVKPLSSIVACLRMKGHSLSVTQFQEVFHERVILKKEKETNSSLAYPELQQYFTRFFGYSFLKWDRNFDIKNHVNVYTSGDRDQLIITHEELIKIWEDLMIKPFRKDRSPWEIVIVDNYVNGGNNDQLSADWIFFLRIHHGLADGFSFQKIICSFLDTTDYEPNFPARRATKLQTLLMGLKCLIMGPYEFLNKSVRYAEPYHSLHYPFQDLSNEYFVVESDLFPVNAVKQIRSHFKVAFTTVLATMICGGLRKFLLKNSKPFPEAFTISIPFATPERSQNLGNEFYLAPVNVPLHLPKRKERLQDIQLQLKNISQSTFTIMFNRIIGRLGMFPSKVFREITRKCIFSTSYSTIPGPEKILKLKGFPGCEMIEANFAHGMASDSLGLGFSTITFNGNMRMTIFVEKNLVESREFAQQIIECIMDEYLEMRQQSASSHDM